MSSPQSIREILHASYERSNWQSLLQDLIPEGSLSLLGTPQDLEVTADQVTETLQLGTITLPGDDEKIALLEITTTDQVKLARNRVGLRNFVANFIDLAQASAVLAVFRQPGSPDWRLTFAARKTTLDQDTFEITTVETAPRRFTFLLGENEACRTAAGRLGLLSDKKDDLSLRDLENAFSVESLSKQFFKKYKEHYLDFVAHLFSDEEADKTRDLFGITEIDDDFATGKANKPVRDFVKTLLGRLVFLTFLQKKGWLGCPANSRQWKGGDPDFLQSFLRLASDQNEPDLFHSKYLTALFFDALNNDETEHFHLTDSRLPYLNGGLFEDNDDHARSLDFPPQLFHNLLDFFDEYNFTIDENDPEDHEVGIDPEMLGMIFENLLEDNKEKGTYYTPKAIVSYMARQSLLHYLQTHLGESEDLETLLNEKNSDELPPFAAKHREQIADLLDRVTICDPAIGSGAFPIGLLHEILWTRLTLEPEKNTPENRAALKRNIIQNSIHGVDIDPGAIEIARLRFWLALVVDEDKPRPLPNLDYKIHRADSLIEYIRGEPVDLGTETPKDEATQEAVSELIAAKQDLFTAQGLPGKRKAWFSLYRALAQLAQAEFTWMRNDTNFDDAEKLAFFTKGITDFGKWIKQIDAVKKEKVHVQERLLAELRTWFDDDDSPTFLWNLHFGGIFTDGGFDIVIANPPFGATLQQWEKDLLKVKFAKWIQRIPNTFIYFYGLASDIGKENAIISFILPNEIFFQVYMENARREIIENQQCLNLINLGDGVFDGATVPSGIILSRLSDRISYPCLADFRNLRKHQLHSGFSNIPDPTTSSDVFLSFPGSIFSFDVRSLDIIRKLNTRSTPFIDFCKTLENGVSTGCDPVYFKSFRELSDILDINQSSNIKPALRGSDIKPYFFIDPENVLLYITKDTDYSAEIDLTNYLEENKETLIRSSIEKRKGKRKWDILFRSRKRDIFESPKIVFRQTGDSVIAALDWDQNYLTINSVNVAPLNTANKKQADYLIATLHSNVIAYYYQAISQEAGRALAEVKPSRLKHLPIPPASDSDKARLATLAEKCAEAAAADDQPTLEAHEHEINQIVYSLFDLTAGEIALIESSLES